MSFSLRRSLLTVAGLTCAICCFATCSTGKSPGVEAVGTAGVDAAAIGVDTSDLYVGITNNAGRPLERVQIAIQVIGNVPPFTATIGRMENGERRELVPSSFRSNDGTTFSPRVHRPRQVTVTAADIVGKNYQIARPWKR